MKPYTIKRINLICKYPLMHLLILMLCLYMLVVWNHLYKTGSFCDKGTLEQLANLINQANIPTRQYCDHILRRWCVWHACSVIGFGLMTHNFSIATQEGDDRLLHCWNVFILYFKADGRTTYAVSQSLSHRWYGINRTCNSKGGKKRNVSSNLQNEHLNRNFKDAIRTFRAKISDVVLQRVPRLWANVRDADISGQNGTCEDTKWLTCWSKREVWLGSACWRF